VLLIAGTACQMTLRRRNLPPVSSTGTGNIWREQRRRD
jgi:hypothetical protein